MNEWHDLAVNQARILARVDRLVHRGYGHVAEYTVLELAPSGAYIKMRNSRDIESWYKTEEVVMVERLPQSDTRERIALQAILVYDTEHNGQLSPVAALARDGLGLPPIEPPPIDQAMAELREKFGHHFDGVDAEQFVREQRDV